MEESNRYYIAICQVLSENAGAGNGEGDRLFIIIADVSILVPRKSFRRVCSLFLFVVRSNQGILS